MASKKKQKGMVLRQEGATTPAAAPAADHLPARFVVPKPGKASEGGMEQSTSVTNEEADMMGKTNIYPSKEPIRTSDGLPTVKHAASSNPQSDNLSPESACKGIKVTLDNNGMWNEFFRCKTEMILTKQGSRMFPYCRFRISGLQPSKKYTLFMDIQPSDNSRYKWTGKSWQVAGKAECHVKSQPFAHPESPSTGQHWMQNPVSFYKLKLTNSISEQEGNTILHPMHRYLPRLHVVQTDKAAKDIKLNSPSVVTFTFHQTEFMAVTAYQNSRFSQLKVDYNPFAKGLKEEGSSLCGLKLKSNSSKESHKDGGTTTNEQHPVKKSLKSLLANHKPSRSSKAVDAKPSGSGDLQKKSTTNEDQSAANVTEERSCSNSRPAQKLFSELIREAHVSLHRCNLDQLGINNSTAHRTERINSKTTALKSNGPDVPNRDRTSVKTNSETSPAKRETKRKVKKDKDILNSLTSTGNDRTDCSEVNNVAAPAVSQVSSVDSDHHQKPEAPSEAKVKLHKRTLPLPALALFLKQHSTKSKLAKSKVDPPPPALSSESQSTAAALACPPSDHPSKATSPLKDLTGDNTKSNNEAFGRTWALIHPDEIDLNVTGQAAETAQNPSSPSCPDAVAAKDPKELRTDDFLASVLVAESTGLESAVPDGEPVLPNSDQPFILLGTSISTISATPAASLTLSPPLDTVLPAANSPQMAAITESSTLPSDLSTMKSDSLLPDPECSSFGFEPLSPASSPEPLPSLPISLALELDTTTSESTPKAVSPEELQHSEDSASSVFKWHTVLPPPEPYVDTPFTTFQPTPQALPSESVTSPLLPSQTPTQPEPQTLDTSTSMPAPEPAPSFQENEQSLPFPAELSPLVLQMPLSPTFSSLDGDGLSPTPSIADLVHFFSTNDDLGMEVEFSNTEAVAVPCPPPSTVEANAHELPQQMQPIPANKPCKHKRKTRQRKLADMDQKMDSSTYSRMQPNLEEVEEQLFISFTSKEALKLHIADSSDGTVSQPQTTPEGHLQQTADAPENGETDVGSEETIAGFEKILLRDLKLMRHGQVIHPVLQEVGLKMNLLDPTLAIDLQYLGVRLPIPPPGVSLEPLPQELPPPPGVSAAFVSRTGKTTDVTQIKGWREKFTPSEAPPTPSPAKPEAGPSSDLPKRNLSAFCSDMLDEYLENEGKLIDERAASFSQPLVEPVVYELPTRSTSYVRTLDSVLKKQTASSPTSDLISGFIPPSKRPKLTLREAKTTRRQKGPKHYKPRAEPAPGSTPATSPAESNLVPKPPAVQISPSSEHPVTESQKSKKHHHQPLSPQPKNRKKLRPKTSSQTLSPLKSTAPPPDVSEDMAPLESDSEVGTAVDHSDDTGRPLMTRALLRQKDLEDGVAWEGRPRTSITEERATIALTSLFTLKGFVCENPTAPIQLVRRRAPPCLNESCRLGCVCSSLSHCSRISHCGRLQCMLGCSCLKQKVVLLKNLDGSDSSPSQHGHNKKRKRRRRMKMAYVLKEADSVSQPAERVRTLWKRGSGDSESDPIHVPESAPLTRLAVRTERGEEDRSCARVRAYLGRKKRSRKRRRKDLSESCAHPQTTPPVSGLHSDLKETPKHVKQPKVARLKPLKRRDLTLKDTKTKPSSPPAADDPVQPSPSDRRPSPHPEPPTKQPPKPPSKRLVIMAECKWASDGDRNRVLKRLCEAMAQDRLDEPFWIRKYLISPISQTVEVSGADRCIHYKIHISRPKLEREKPEKPVKPVKLGKPEKPVILEKPEKPLEPVEPERPRKTKQQQEHLPQMVMEVEPLEDWQREVEEDEEEEEEEVEPLEDWQREVEEGDFEDEDEEAEKMMKKKKKKKMVSMALPFLTGVSPAGFLSANRKQPGGTDHLVQVNGKLYPLAKIQLGKMGALHPANRLAAYLTGRVGSNRKQQGSSSSSSKPPQNQSSGPPPPTVSSASSVVSTPPPRSQPSVTVLTIPPPPTDSKVSSSVAPPVNPPPKGSQLLMLQVQAPPGALPLPIRASCPPPSSSSSGQRMVLQPVQTASGVQYYRRPDGKLVQLVPISQLRPVNSNLSVQRGSSSVLPAASLQTPVISIGNQTPPLTTVTSILPSSSSSLSGLQSFSVSPLASPLRLNSGFLAQKGTCTFKILPPNSSRDPIIVTCPKLPPKVEAAAPGSFTVLQPHAPATTPVNLISLKPSTGRGAELGVKTVTVSAVPVVPGAMLVQKPTIQTPAGTGPSTLPPAPPKSSEVTPVTPPYPEPACDLVDLDIICVDDDIVTTDTAGGAKQSLDAVELKGSSSETDNSSDFGDDSDSEEEKDPNINIHRHIHNVLERQRRVKLHQLFEGLRRELGLSEEKTSKICTLKKAEQVIQELRTTETDLEKKKRKLMKRRDEYLTIIAPTTESSQVTIGRWRSPELSEGGGTGSKDTDVMEMVDLSDELTENSSDEERLVTKTTNVITVTNAKDEVPSVAMETLENSRLNEAQRKLAKIMRNVDSESSLSVKKLVGVKSLTSAFKDLRSVMNTKHSSKRLLLKQAHQEIQTLQSETARLRSLKICLNQQRDAFIREISQRSGGGKQRIQRKLQHLAPKQDGVSDPPAGDSTDDDIIITSSDMQQQTPQAPPTPVSAPPIATPAVPAVQQPQRTLLVSKPALVSGASHSATVVRPRTVPNILSRSRNPATSPSFQPVVPTEVLSLVSAALPGQPVLTMSPLMAGPTVLQTSTTPGVASVTLNIPNQQIHLTSLPHPPTAADFNNLLQLVQPSTTQPQQILQTPQQILQTPQQILQTPQQILQTPQQQQQKPSPPQQQRLPAGQPLLVSAGSDLSSGHFKDQDQPESSSMSPPSPEGGPSSSLCPGPTADQRAEVPVGGPVGAEQQQETGDDESLTSLLNELVFLNQQAVTSATTAAGAPSPGIPSPEDVAVGGATEQGHPPRPWVLELDSDSDNDHTEMILSGPQPEPANGNANVLAPPPLLQMKVGGAKVADPASSDGAAGGEEEAGGGGRREGGVAWRPMPRLVPLGLRGNPSS